MPTRTKIIVTLGPSSANEDVLRQLIERGVRIFRLNFSHGQASDFTEIVALVRRLGKETGRPLTLMQDLSGPKIRIGDIGGKSLDVSIGDSVFLGLPEARGEVPGKRASDKAHFMPLDFPDIMAGLEPGDTVAVSDGGLQFTVQEVLGKGLARLTANNHGILTSRKGLTFPGKTLPLRALTEKDMVDLRDGLEMGVDAVAISYVQSHRDVFELKQEIARLGAWVPVVAKLERHNALEDLENIVEEAHVIMVARGDLGLELPLEELPAAQKRIIATCNRKGKPVVVATQMLLSMVNSPMATRAETTDVANAVLDGADCVMLSEETAIGRYPVETVNFMRRTTEKAEELFFERSRGPLPPSDQTDTAKYLAYAACKLADNAGAQALVSHTASGSSARLLSACRPRQPIVALSPNPRVLHHMNFSWGVTPNRVPEDSSDHLDRSQRFVDASPSFIPGSSVVITAGQPKPGEERSRTNVVKIYQK